MAVFFDSNVLIYALVADDPRQRIAMRCLEDGGFISVQVLNECASVARRKLKMSWSDVEAALRSFRAILPPPSPVTLDMHETAVGLAGRYDFAFYDALIVAAALHAKCDRLLSEDMHDGMRIEGVLTIENPFSGVRILPSSPR